MLYQQAPKLKQIEDELNHFAIKTAKNILKNNDLSINELESKVLQLKKEKTQILKELNLPSDYLQPFYSCKICNDTGYIMNNNYKTEMCNCLKQKLFDLEYNQSNTFDIKNISLDKFSLEQYSPVANPEKYDTIGTFHTTGAYLQNLS